MDIFLVVIAKFIGKVLSDIAVFLFKQRYKSSKSKKNPQRPPSKRGFKITKP